MNDKLLALRVFVRVAHTGSFSAAGLELNLSQPSVSRIIAADHAARGSAELRGSLRVAMPQSFGVREVISLLPEFPARHPALNLSFSMSDQRQGGAAALREVTPVRSVPCGRPAPRRAAMWKA